MLVDALSESDLLVDALSESDLLVDALSESDLLVDALSEFTLLVDALSESAVLVDALSEFALLVEALSELAILLLFDVERLLLEEVDMESLVLFLVTSYLNVDVDVFPVSSFEVIVMVKLPILLGVPLIVFVFESNVRPSGKPDTSLTTLVPLLSVVLIVIGWIGL